MLTLLRLPFNRSRDPRMAPHARALIRFSFFIEELWGSAPRARQGKAPADAGADPSGLPGLPRFVSVPNLRDRHALVQTRFSRSGPSRAGDPPPLGSPWRLLPPVSPTGRGAGARVAPAPKKEIDHVGQER